MPVHDVDMDDAGAALRRPLHLIRQVSEIRREYRGCKFDKNRVQEVGSKAVEILARWRWLGGPCGNGRPRPFMPGESQAVARVGADAFVRPSGAKLRNLR